MSPSPAYRNIHHLVALAANWRKQTINFASHSRPGSDAHAVPWWRLLLHDGHCQPHRFDELKLKFHGTDTDSDTDTDILAGSRRAAARSACHEPDTHDNPRRLVRRLDRHARFSSRGSSRGCPLGMRACTRVNVYSTR